MKKITSFLLVLFATMVVNAQTTTETYDFKNWPDADVQLATSTEVMGTAWETGNAKYQSIYQCTTEGLERFAFQGYTNVYTGKGYWLRVGYGLQMTNATRSMAVLDLSKGDLVTFYTSGTIDFSGGGTGDGTWFVNTVDGGYAVTMTSDGNLGCCLAKSNTITSITIEFGAVNLDEAVAVTGITLDKSAVEVTEGMTVNLLTATVTPDNATDKSVTWTSSDENIATVSDGKITGVSLGSATITAQSGEFTATCEVTVKGKVVKTSWDFADLYSQSGSSRVYVTYAENTVKIGGQNCNYGIENYEGLAIQAPGGWFLYTTGGLYQGNGGGRNIGVLNLKEGSVVTVVASKTELNGTEGTALTLADNTTAEETSVDTEDGRVTHVYTMVSDGHLTLSVTRYFSLFSIDVTEPLVIEDNYNESDTYPDFESLIGDNFYYGKITYNRDFTADYYYLMVLPFAPDETSLQNYSFYKLSSVADDAVTFAEETAPVANTPYLCCLKEGATITNSITGGPTTVSTEVNNETVGTWTLVGSLKNETVNSTSADNYLLHPTNKTLHKVTSSLTVYPYTAYLQKSLTGIEVAPATMRLFISGPTGIKEISVDRVEGFGTGCFDLQGRPITKPMKGQIYIKDGKKIMH